MPGLLADLPPLILLSAVGIALLAGVIKGLVGFAMPMVLISGLGSVISPELALAGLILPTLATNGFQAMAQGPRAAFDSVMRFRVFLGALLVLLLLSSQLVSVLPTQVLLLMIGGPITLFALLQLAGWQPRVGGEGHRGLEIGIGGIAGFIGGLSGVWGPPTVAYLTAMGTEKREQMRVQGVIYGLGAVALTVGHLGSGVLNGRTVWLSLLLLPPALIGMWLGGRVQDRIDQQAFRRATLVVLLVAGLNLVRRALL
ncbi:sulfite exporter TauE/SafE family protein [Mameliella sediminis]|uniref:sulfite exporter TauE/SafE family protein n=1 Tax=Mameliella sediminis TaxID=2836866 RepID=UPI001C43E94D|nr:sulfite exporter TauE/SafE family protein [Mameliella sediminis]MBV7394325.1 sulfite exporter TauE/SafE family protein [Mameliella sediminis]